MSAIRCGGRHAQHTIGNPKDRSPCLQFPMNPGPCSFHGLCDVRMVADGAQLFEAAEMVTYNVGMPDAGRG
jgi:hypothetical protein